MVGIAHLAAAEFDHSPVTGLLFEAFLRKLDDLAIVRRYADDVCVMKDGDIVEI